jgi:autotransporter-associated beta strand protein
MTGNGASAWGNVAWHLNGTLTSSGNSTINYTATGNHNLGLQNGDLSNPFTTFNVVSDTLTVSANIVDGLAGPNGSYNARATTLVKTGAGTMTLTGNDTYTGNTYVNAGTLNATTGINTPSAIVGVADGATLTATSIVADSLSIGGGPYGAPVVNACPVPEPGSLTLLVLAGLGALVAVWRRK